jgi:transposase
LVSSRLIDPGSEFRLHREWFERSAMADLLGETFRIAAKNTLYRCLDQLLAHKEDLFGALQSRWKSLFDVGHDVLLYDLTSTYFECDPPQSGKRRYGHSRDHRPDCVQVVIALVVTPEGFPLAYEIYPGNTQDQATLRGFLEQIEKQYGKARRVWLMDRGIPTESTLKEMREQGGKYLVGTPKGRLSKLEEALLSQQWRQAREHVRVKLLEEGEEFYVYVESADRVTKERAMRRRRLKRLWKRLQELQQMKKQSRDDLLMRLGAARKAAGLAWSLVSVRVPEKNEPVTPDTFGFQINRSKLRQRRRREGRYLLRSNMTRDNPEDVWEKYVQLTQIEQAFKDLKSDLSIRPIYHQTDERIEAHIFVSFLSYCLFVTLRHLLRPHATGLTPRSVIEKVCQLQIVDIHLPTTDARTIVLSRHTEPEPDLNLLLEKLKLCLPAQPPPRVYSHEKAALSVVPT